jgi:hypothetical protein
MVGTPLVQRRRDGLRQTVAGRVLLDGVPDRAGPGRPGGKPDPAGGGPGTAAAAVVRSSCLPESLAAAAGLRTAAAVQVDVAWLEMPLDAEFSLIGTRRADAGLGWLTARSGVT